MRIHLVNRFYWPDESATAQLVTDLSLALAAEGHEVSVITSRQLSEDAHADLPPKAARENVAIHRLPTTRFGRQYGLLLRAVDFLSFYVSLLFSLLRQLRRGDTVVALTDPPLQSVVVAFACLLCRARLVNWLQDLYPEVAVNLGVIREHSMQSRALSALRNWSLRRAELNVAIGEQMAERLRLASGAVQVIHNWASDLACHPAPAPDNAYRMQTGCGQALLVGYSGNLGRAHRFEALIEASCELAGDNGHHVLVIGGGHQFDSIQKTVKARGMRHWHVLPYQPRTRLAESLSASDVHIVSLEPALEGLIVPSKLYGVLAAGRASIFLGDQNGEVATMLKRHDCGWVVDPEDSVGLAKLLRTLSAEREMVLQKGRNARRAFDQLYSPRIALGEWRRQLESLK